MGHAIKTPLNIYRGTVLNLISNNDEMDLFINQRYDDGLVEAIGSDVIGVEEGFQIEPVQWLPCPRQVRLLLRLRYARANFFGASLFSDPAWNMILDLTAAKAEGAKVSISSLCIASAVPNTTALRWVSQLVQLGIFERIPDDTDNRRTFIELSDYGVKKVNAYFKHCGEIKRLQH